jgi:predicted nucleotidyltransferase
MKEKKKVKASPKILKQHLRPLLKHKPVLESVYVYGSAVTKKQAYDIDVMIIVNDTETVSEESINAIEKECGRIMEKAKKQSLIFHFQPIKLLSRWWHLLIEGTPWIVSSLKNIIVIYDKKGILKEVCGFIKKEHLYKKEEKSEKLLGRSNDTISKNRQLLLNSIVNLSDASTEAAQILLLFDNKFILNKKKIATELEELQYRKILGEDEVGSYHEIIDFEEKMEKGALSEFSAENLDYYLEKIKRFINKVELMLAKK